MSMNPKKSLAAILPLPIRIDGTDVVVRPMTLGMWAALERIRSPLISGEQTGDTLELIPTLYLLTHNPCEILSGTLITDAMAWADTIGVKTLFAIREAAAKQISAALDVIPEDDTDESKKKPMDG